VSKLEENGEKSVIAKDMFIGDKGLEFLIESTKDKHVNTLDLSGCSIKDSLLLSAFLRAPFGLRNLRLQWNELSKSFSHLASSLEGNRTLEELDLRNNKLGPNEASLLANALYKNHTLRRLDLRWNRLAVEGADALASALMESNKTLIDLKLSGNDCESRIPVIESLLQRNREGQRLNETFQDKNQAFARSTAVEQGRLETKVTYYQKYVDEQERELIGAKHDRTSLEKTIEELQGQIQLEKESGIRSRGEVDRLKMESRDLLNEVASLKSRLESVEQENGVLRKNLEHERQQKRVSDSEREALISKSREMELALAQARDSLSTSEAEREEVKADLRVQKAEVMRLTEQYRRMVDDSEERIERDKKERQREDQLSKKRLEDIRLTHEKHLEQVRAEGDASIARLKNENAQLREELSAFEVKERNQSQALTEALKSIRLLEERMSRTEEEGRRATQDAVGRERDQFHRLQGELENEKLKTAMQQTVILDLRARLTQVENNMDELQRAHEADSRRDKFERSQEEQRLLRMLEDSKISLAQSTDSFQAKLQDEHDRSVSLQGQLTQVLQELQTLEMNHRTASIEFKARLESKSDAISALESRLAEMRSFIRQTAAENARKFTAVLGDVDLS